MLFYDRLPVLAICFFDAFSSLVNASFFSLRLDAVSTGSKINSRQSPNASKFSLWQANYGDHPPLWPVEENNNFLHALETATGLPSLQSASILPCHARLTLATASNRANRVFLMHF